MNFLKLSHISSWPVHKHTPKVWESSVCRGDFQTIRGQGVMHKQMKAVTNHEILYTSSEALVESRPCSSQQLPQLSAHMLGFSLSLPHFPISSLLLHEIISQINHLHSNPCLKLGSLQGRVKDSHIACFTLSPVLLISRKCQTIYNI